ncbi:MAG: dephospho-CoA kinase [Sodalis sp. Psp]|nr:dephospho-CoA kinase [Sodalis sp. Psp]MCR3756727.1 dephospho-CoA kinase [Sodalis sp. Ppy]
MIPYIVALTGGIGSGKSTAANAFAKLGVPLIDADLIARQVVSPGSSILRTIAQRFSPAILRADGSLDRAALRELIFSDAREKSWLNGLLHPLIQERATQQLRFIQTPYVLWVVPLLIENNLQHRANRVLVVDVEPEIQIARILSRDAVSRAQVDNILAAQVSRQQRLACADDVIDNSRRHEEIIDQVAILHRNLVLVASTTRQAELT